ncbi:MAG: glycosyltransferase [Solirubrobacterales bacterium]
MTRVLLATVRLLEFFEGAGHFWVYMQYAQALRQLGCEVYLLDSSIWSDHSPDEHRVREFRDRMARYGLEDRVMLAGNGVRHAEPGLSDLLDEVDLLLNFNYHLSPEVVSAVRRSALVDIDPGLLQFWISRGFISPAAHDLYFTTGETVANGSDLIPDCGLEWVPIRPPVYLDLWPYTRGAGADAFTTVSSWWGERDYVGDPESYYDNTKRTAFLEFIDLPRHTEQPLELALFLADSDRADRRSLEDRGWRVRHSRDVAGSPEQYRAYVQSSRGEFSWAKASCVKFQNAWISDRSLCYLASGKPVVVQHTGPSSCLPDGEGIFRFRTLADAAQAFDSINADYERQCRLARNLAEQHFDAEVVVSRLLERAL